MKGLRCTKVIKGMTQKMCNNMASIVAMMYQIADSTEGMTQNPRPILKSTIFSVS